MQDTRDKQKVELKTKQVNGRGGAPALMHCPAAVEAAPNPEKRGEYAHTPSGPYSAAARAPLSRTARSALDKVRVLFKQHHHLLQQTSFLMYSSTQLYEGPPHGPRVWLRGWKLYWLALAACFSRIFCSLSSGCLVRGVRGCGGHRLGSHLGLLGLFVFRFRF